MRRRRQWLAVLLAGMMLAGSTLPVYAQEEMLEAPVESGSAQSAAASYALAADEEGWNGTWQRTPQEIMDYLNELGDAVYGSYEMTFDEEPSTSAPYAPGKLSLETQQHAIDTLNAIRYIAGIPADVTYNESYAERAQAGMLVNYVLGELAHEPSKPADMDDALYQLGFSGTSSSNIAWASWSGRSLSETLIYSWMEDGDMDNIPMVGHRRWLLNPDMGQTAFGMVDGDKGTYSAVYVFDYSGTSTENYYDVAWPARVMPTEFFGEDFPWSISTGTYQDESQVQVNLVQNRTGQEWNFSASGSDGEFYVNNGGYGQTGCIIFRPDNLSYQPGDTFQVTVTGLSGGRTLQYPVLFFDTETGAGADGTVKEGWIQEDGEWHFYQNGTQVMSGWVSVQEEDPYNGNQIGKVWYHIGANGTPGKMDTGWIEDETGWKHYYLDTNGRMMHDVWANAQEQPAIGMPEGLYYLQSDGSVQMNGWAQFSEGAWLFCRPGDGLVQLENPDNWASRKLW